MNKGDSMTKEKRNIATKLETESKYLTNILDKDDVKNFKKLIPELQDTWMKKQMFRMIRILVKVLQKLSISINELF